MLSCFCIRENTLGFKGIGELYMEQVRIQLEGISKSYYAKTAVTQALRKINLTFRMGEFVAITGESGSGKSTLLNIIGGMDTFDDGEMYVDGQPTFQYDEEDWEEYRRNKIGYVFQDYSLIGHYTVLDNMMSGLLIMGLSSDEAKNTARHYLKLVGLEEYELHKATELSSGQKQRLSIARALAKNTGIIVADEPTGNLDSETGDQIIALLKELSKDRLVIMVTHNYEQAEKYVTRKIRIHEGEVVVDVLVNNGEEAGGELQGESVQQQESSEQEKVIEQQTLSEQEGEASRKKVFWEQFKTAWYFASKNAVTQLGRATLFTIFLSIIAIASFVLLGQLLVYEDDISTKIYSNKAFYRQDDTRLVVKKADGSLLTDADFAKMKELAYVVDVDSCDYANDINYYVTEDEDYEYLYSWHWGSRDPVITLKFLSDKKFMKSVDCITEQDLAYGRLPEKRNEIVIYDTDDSLLNRSKKMYFKANNIWDSGEYYEANLKIVGILKEETEQIYFSKALCQMLSMDIDSDLSRIVYAYDYRKMDYAQKPEMVLVIADDLKGNQVRVSKDIEVGVTGEILFRCWEYDENGEISKEYVEQTVVVQKKTTGHTRDFLEVSQELFDKYYQAENKQASVYIASYAKTDEVISALERLGYSAISTIRVSTTDYDELLVFDRLKVMGICFGGLLALIFAEVLILRSLMKIRVKDYFVLKFIGMKMQMIRKISYLEIGVYVLVAMGITVALMWALNFAGIPLVTEMMWYYELKGYIAFAAYNLFLSVLTVASFNRLLKGRLNV